MTVWPCLGFLSLCLPVSLSICLSVFHQTFPKSLLSLGSGKSMVPQTDVGGGDKTAHSEACVLREGSPRRCGNPESGNRARSEVSRGFLS